MTAQSTTEQRTEQPTLLRLAEAREQGRVVRSADLTGAAVILGAVAALWLGGGMLLNALIAMLMRMLSFEPTVPSAEAASGQAIWSAVAPLVWITVGFGAMLMLVAIVAGILQVGLHVSGAVIEPKFDRLSPGEGLRRVFSSRGLVRALLAITKIVAVVFVAWLTIGGCLGQIADGCGLGVAGQWSGAWSLMGLMAWRILVVLIVLGGLDWAWQWRMGRHDLMMTRREVLDDLRKMEGDPLMRSRMRKKRQSKTGDQS